MRNAPGTKSRKIRPLAIVILAVAVVQTGLAASAADQNTVAQTACAVATTADDAAGDSGVAQVKDATSTAKSATCLRFRTRFYTSGGSDIRYTDGVFGVPALIDVNGDAKPDISATATLDGLNTISVTFERMSTAPAKLPLKVEVLTGIAELGKVMAFGYDSDTAASTAYLTDAPKSFVVKGSRIPGAQSESHYRVEVTNTPQVAGSPLSLVAGLFTPNGDEREDLISGRLEFAPMPQTAAFEIVDSADHKTLTVDSSVDTSLVAAVSNQSGTTDQTVTGTIEKLPARSATASSLKLDLSTTADGRRTIGYATSKKIGYIKVATSNVKLGSLGNVPLVAEAWGVPSTLDVTLPSASAPFQFAASSKTDKVRVALAGASGPFRDMTATVTGIPSSLSVTMPTASAPFQLSASSTTDKIEVTMNGLSVGRYKELYATITGIPASLTINPPTDTGVTVKAGTGQTIGSIDIELTDGTGRITLPLGVDGVYLRRDDSLSDGADTLDAVHARITSLRTLAARLSPDVDVTLDSTAGRTLMGNVEGTKRVCVFGLCFMSTTYYRAKLSALKPNTRVTASATGGVYRIGYSDARTSGSGPRLDIDTNAGDRISLHADIPVIPQTVSACVSTNATCMRPSSNRVSQRNNAHQKAVFALDFVASQQMTINVLDCLEKKSGSTSSCGEGGYGKWLKGSITVKDLALDAWVEWVDEDWDIDNLLGHVFIDTNGNPVTTDINYDDVDGNDYNVEFNGLWAKDKIFYFDRDWSALMVGDGIHEKGSWSCGSSPELEIRPEWPDWWFNVAGFFC